MANILEMMKIRRRYGNNNIDKYNSMNSEIRIKIRQAIYDDNMIVTVYLEFT